jgi:Tfp pilus assembly protein PilE
VKKNRKGFSTVECVISVSILAICTYIVSTALINTYRQGERSLKEREMLYLAQTHLSIEKNNVKDESLTPSIGETRQSINGYEVIKSVQKNNALSDNYKIDIRVRYGYDEIELVSYVTE